MKKHLLFGFALIFVSTGLFGQELHPAGPFYLNFDYARFRYSDRSNYLEVYYAFQPRDLTYSWSEADSAFTGAVKLWLTIRDPKTGSDIIKKHALLTVQVEDTLSPAYRRYFISQSGYEMPFGEFEIAVLAVDSLQEARRDSIRLPLQIIPFPTRASASDLELCGMVQSSSDTANDFYKNSLLVIPNPTLVFGLLTNPVLFYYLELYNILPEVPYAVESAIYDSKGNLVRRSIRRRTYASPNAVEAGMTNVGTVPTGVYRYQVRLLDQDSQEVLRSVKKFYVLNPGAQRKTQALPTISQALAKIPVQQLDQEFRYARYLAYKSEIQLYSQLTSPEAKRKFLAKFWAEVLKGRKYFPSIERSVYLDRVKVVNRKYGSFTKSGWQTDRGRVFLIYGEPDEIERFPSTSESKPYEIWHYYNIENGVEFIFVDRSGSGNYELVHSTKRGELQDENWERYLH